MFNKPSPASTDKNTLQHAWPNLEMHYVSPLAWEGFRQCMLRCILWPWCHWRVGQLMLDCILCALRHWRGLVNRCLETFLSLLAWDEFDLHVLRSIFSIWLLDLGLVNASWDSFFLHARFGCILCPRRHIRGFRNTYWDAVCVLTGIGWVR